MTGDEFMAGASMLGPLVGGRGWCQKSHPEDRVSSLKSIVKKSISI